MILQWSPDTFPTLMSGKAELGTIYGDRSKGVYYWHRFADDKRGEKMSTI